MDRSFAVLAVLALLTGCDRSTQQPTTTATTAPPIELPACEAEDRRTSVALWTPTYNEWKSTLSSLAPQREGNLLYIKFLAPADRSRCDTADVYRLRASSDLKRPKAGGFEVGFVGNTTHLRGVCHVEGIFMNRTSAGIQQGWMATTYEAIDTKDVVLAGRYCLGPRVPEPSTEELEALGDYDRLLVIERVEVAHVKGDVGAGYEQTTLHFAPAASSPGSAVCAGCRNLSSVSLPYKAKISFWEDPADPDAEHRVSAIAIQRD